MNCIVVDDEPLALNLLRDFINKVPFLNLIKLCKDAYDAIEVMQSSKVDLMFLDINMPEITGLELIKNIEYKPLVIFTTAYSQHAVQGFELNAIDYLVKPFLFERFFKAVNKAFDMYNLKQESIRQKSKSDNDDFIFVKADYSSVKVYIRDILYIEGLKDYVKIYTNEKKILTLTTMKKIKEKLPNENFIRIHRSYIIAIDKIDSIQRNRIIIGDKWIPIGNSYKEEFFKRIDDVNV